jgi:hypothetical protein
VTVLEELSKYKLDLMGVQEVRWVGSGIKPEGNIHFPKEPAMKITN